MLMNHFGHDSDRFLIFDCSNDPKDSSLYLVRKQPVNALSERVSGILENHHVGLDDYAVG